MRNTSVAYLEYPPRPPKKLFHFDVQRHTFATSSLSKVVRPLFRELPLLCVAHAPSSPNSALLSSSIVDLIEYDAGMYRMFFPAAVGNRPHGSTLRNLRLQQPFDVLPEPFALPTSFLAKRLPRPCRSPGGCGPTTQLDVAWKGWPASVWARERLLLLLSILYGS